MYFFNLLKFTKFSLSKIKSYPTGRVGKILLNHRSAGNKFFFSLKLNRVNSLSFVLSIIQRKLKPDLYLSVFENGFIGFSLRPQGLKLKSFVLSSYLPLPSVPGNTMPLKFIPVGSRVFNVQDIAKSSGVSIQILRHRNGYTLCKLPSKELKWISYNRLATFGVLTNQDAKFHKYWKAGQLRWIGRRPTVRGVAMNPIDHPHGGGQGKTSGGRPSVSPYSILTKGYKTKNKYNKFIFKRAKI